LSFEKILIELEEFSKFLSLSTEFEILDYNVIIKRNLIERKKHLNCSNKSLKRKRITVKKIMFIYCTRTKKRERERERHFGFIFN